MAAATARSGVWSRVAWRRVVPIWLGFSTIAVVLAIRAFAPAPFLNLQAMGFDAMQRIAPRPYVPVPVRIVDIDDESLKRLGQWPWSRDLLSALTERIAGLGAASIAFDVLFSERDRTSPSLLMEKWRARSGFATAAISVEDVPDYDRRFAEAIASGPVVLPVALVGSEQPAAPAVKVGFALVGDDPAGSITQYPGAVTNLPMLEAAAKGIGSFSITADDGETVRRFPLLARHKGRIIPSLPLEALRVARGADTIALRRDQSVASVSPLRLRVGDIIVRADADSGLRMYFTGPVPERTIPAWLVLAPDQTSRVADRIAGHIVLVGTSASGLSDILATPLGPFEHGVSIYAQAVEQMLLGVYLDRPAWLAAAEMAAAVVLAAGLVLACALRNVLWGFAALAATVVVAPAAAWYGYTDRHLLVDPTLVCIAAVIAAVATVIARYFLIERDGIKLKRAFSQYLAPALVEQLVQRSWRVQLDGEPREISCLFTDLEGFSDFAEHCPPEQLVAVLNTYLDSLCSIAMDHGGTIVKLIGDAVHVIFNAPVDQPDHAVRAVACARAMDAFSVQFSAQQRRRNIPFGSTRIGVNTGCAIVGNFGGHRRFDYSAYGDTVNTAARLEAVNKILGTRICIARSTVDRCGSGTFRPIGSVVLRAKAGSIDIFEPIDGSVADAPWLSSYLEAFSAYSAGSSRGREMMLAYAASRPADPIGRLLARRITDGDWTPHLYA
ncbi:MAG: adenylate/guanylate cyclase domain-containing protein [Xanthobacteraceae bacterium]